MKKAKYLMMLCAGALLLSCEKDDIENTATEPLAGEWYVTVEAVDANGTVLYTDDELYGLGHFKLNTYNTAANKPTEMYVDDMENFWSFKSRVNTNIEAMTFSTNGAVANDYDADCKVTIEEGKVLLKAATSPHGTAVDSICFYVTFSDDQNVPDSYSKLKVAGYRYTGLAQDD